MLLKHLARPDFAYRHRWEEGDVVIWDNRSTQHIAMADFGPPSCPPGRFRRRTLRRLNGS